MARSATRPEHPGLHHLTVALYHRLGAAELPVVRAHGMSLWGYEVLRRIVAASVTSQVTLVSTLGLDKTKVLRIVDELELAGLAERIPTAGVRRKRQVAPTDHGRATAALIHAELAEVEARLFDHITPGERDRFLRTLARIVAALP